MTDALAISYKDAARLLSIRDTRTIGRMVDDGKLRAVGEGSGRKIVVASIHEYLEERSAWHAQRNPSDHGDAREVAPFVIGAPERSRGKHHSLSGADTIESRPLLRGKTLRRI